MPGMFNGTATEYVEHIFKIKAYVGKTGFRRERGEILRVAPTEANDMDDDCKHYTSNTAKFFEKWLRRKQRLR